MKLKELWIDGFKNLNDFKIDFTNKDGITVLIGNNGSGKSNILEAISEIFATLYTNKKASSSLNLITDININFNDELTTEDLSEGQKKQILIKVALDIIADEKSLILLDEPDSSIHVSNKQKIKSLLDEYDNRNTILTTHSPTLMNEFEKNLIYLEHGENLGKEKADILQNIAGDIMSVTEQQIILNSNSDILIVEGKTDEKYITVALEKLKISYSKYQELNFNFLYMGGSDPDNLKKLVNQFTPKENQTIIAFFDNDGASFKCIKKAFNYSMDKIHFTRKIENNIHICLYPKKDGFEEDAFEVEDYFKIETCRDYMFDNFETFQDTKKKFPKNNFADYCSSLDVTEFEGFEKLFNLILDIKGL